MDIIDVTRSRLKASLDEATFDMNSVLQQPIDQGAIERFTKALQKYSHTILQLETLLRLQQELERADQQPAVDSETKEE